MCIYEYGLMLREKLQSSLQRRYVGLGVLAGFLLYLYLLYVHMNGRMLDVYRRLHGSTESFFVPHDFEVTCEFFSPG